MDVKNVPYERSHSHLDHADDFEELRAAAMEDIYRKGLGSRMQKRFGSLGDVTKADTAQNRKEGAHALVKSVMETSGGDNEALARKVHARYDAVGLKQPSVEVRFDNLCASASVPAGSTEGLFTVGVDLTVKALTAVAAATRQKPPMQEFRILQNLSGVFKPGRICLLLGPPGGGKSMLMKALCGAAPVPVTGDMLYNGHTQEEFNVTRTARYVDQFDLHNPALTVRETLTFSAMCQGPGYHRSMLRLLEEKEKKAGITPDAHVAELMSGLHHDLDPSCNVALTLQLLSLVNCADTIVGDGMMRGVSGGEKKRVTTGEVMVGPSKILFMDEISTGLDSASTFTIVQSLTNWAHATDATIVVALLQPEPQVYDLFDDIMLLSNGRIVYQGERQTVEPHFNSLGFECIGKKAVADFLQELVSKKDQRVLRTDASKFEPQLEDFVPAAALAAAFKRSPVFQATRTILDMPFDKASAHPGSLMKSKFGVPGWEALKALMWREQLLLTRDKEGQLYRYLQMLVLAVMLATLFVRGEVTGNDNAREAGYRASVIFFSMAYMQFLGLAECAETMMRLPLFYKHKFKLFFPSWAYAIPFGLIRIPITLIEVTFWSLLVYWVTGMQADAGRFFCFWGTLVCLQLYSASAYRLVGSVVRSLVFGTSVAVIIMLLTFIGSGFVLLFNDIPDWWIWMFWLSPLQYAITGLVNNEFSGKDYDRLVGDQRLGDVVLDNFQFHKGNKWRWMAPMILLSWYVVLNLLNMAALTFLFPPAQPPPPPPPEEDEYHITTTQLQDNPLAANGDAQPKHISVRMLSARAEAKGFDFHFEPVTLAFDDLHYYVPNPAGPGELELLKGVYGVFRPGVLTALMGASGAGKTTLMDVLADRKTAGRATGTVTVNGYPKNPSSFARVMGYCEQFDVHSPGTTVEEAVRMSNLMRMTGDDVDASKREEFVQQTLAIVELDSIAGNIVGIPGMFGLSGEQFKRLTIAVELAANPAIIFCDEPTSGLDARAAQIVMRVVRNIVNNNRTIVCTIHQPSTEIFLHFDELLLLKRGGWPIYYGKLGEDSKNLVDYFQSVPNAKQLQRGYNPATYMLEATSTSEEERLGVEFGELWKGRQLAGAKELVAQHLKPPAGAKELAFSTSYAQNFLVQYSALITRYILAYWRNPPYNTTRIMLSIVAALILGSFFWDVGDSTSTPGEVIGVLGSIFVTVSFIGFINFQMIIPTFFMERPVMYRERASRLYAVFPWVESMVDVEIPWVALQVTIFSVIAYFMIHFEFTAGKFFFFWLCLYISCLIMAYLGMVVVCITPNLKMGITFGATMLGMWFCFAGFLIPRSDTPDWWKWFVYINPTAWVMYAIAADQLGDREELISVFAEDGSPLPDVTVSQYIDDTYDYEYSWRWPSLGIACLMALFLRFVVVVATQYLHFQKR